MLEDRRFDAPGNLLFNAGVYMDIAAKLAGGATIGTCVAVGFVSMVKHGAELHDRVRMQPHCVIDSGVVVEQDAFLGTDVVILTGRMMSTAARRPQPRLRRGCQSA
jgi:UDP-3-O-[3-hydroxymyristoyl] glucosamine N-acyltransferase